MSVDGIDDTYLVRLKVVAALLYYLRDAEQFGLFVCQLPGDVEAVTRSGEIEDDTFLSLSQEVNAVGILNAAAPATNNPIRFSASRREMPLGLSLSVFIINATLSGLGNCRTM